MAAWLNWLIGLMTLVAAPAASQAAGVRGSVLMPDGRPAAGAPVWLFQDSKIVATATSDRRGAFSFHRVPNWNHVAAWPKGAAIASSSVFDFEGGATTLRARREIAVRGTVVGMDGKPVEGATVYVAEISPYPPLRRLFAVFEPFVGVAAVPGMSVKTGKDGAFMIGGIPDDALPRLAATAPHLADIGNATAFSSYYSPLAGIGGEWAPAALDLEHVTITLGPLAKIIGEVTYGGKPLAGAKVSAILMPGSWVMCQADADKAGRYSLEVPPGRYGILAEAPGGLLSEPTILDIHAGAVLGASFEVKRATKVEAVVPLNGSNAKEWTAICQGSPMHGNTAWMDLPSRSPNIDGNGRFAVDLLPGDWYVAAYSSKGSAASDFKILPNQAGQVVKLQLPYYPSKKRHVTVCDQTGKPVPWATVVAMNAVHTDSGGEVWLDQGQTDIEIYAATPDLDQFGSGVFEKDSDRLTITVTPGVQVSGRILDEAGKPIEGACCEVEADTAPQFSGGKRSFRLWSAVSTDSNGHYRFCLPAGTPYLLIIEKVGWGSVRSEVLKVPGESQGQVADMVLEPTDRTASGVVVDLEGMPLPGASVAAHWEPFSGAGMIGQAAGNADPAGAFTIRGLPRKGRLAFDLLPSHGYSGWAGPVTAENYSGLRIVGTRAAPVAPAEFLPGMGLFSTEVVDWIQGEPPKVGDGEISILFATAFDPACEAVEHTLDGGAKAGEGSLRVIVFDAALPLDELKAYVAKLGIEAPVARVKFGPNLGWGGEGLFKRFAVPCVPSWGKVDRSGRPQPAIPDYGESRRPSDTTYRLDYRVRTDWGTAVFGEQARRALGRQTLPVGVIGARYYTVGTGDSTRLLAIGDLNGHPVVVVDALDTGDLAGARILPLPLLTGVRDVVTVALSGTGQGGTPEFLGHYEIGVYGVGTPNESVQFRALGSKVGDIVIDGVPWTSTFTDSDTQLGFTSNDDVSLHGAAGDKTLKLGEVHIDGSRYYRLSVDAMGSRVAVEGMPEYDDATYSEDGLIVSGDAYGERWTSVGSAGRIRIPKAMTNWRSTFTRKASDGRPWTATFAANREGIPPAVSLGSQPLIAAVHVRRDGDVATVEALIAASGGIVPVSVLDPDMRPAKVVVEFVDAAGKVVETLPMSPTKPGVWSVPMPKLSESTTPRLKIEFGPFKVETGPALVSGVHDGGAA